MTFKVKDHVQIINNKKEILAEGEIVNINDFREPSAMYAIQVEGYEDVIFCGENNIVSL